MIIGYDAEVNPIHGDTISVSTPCQKEFHDQVPVLLANPAMLHSVVLTTLAKRFPDVDAPTLAEVEAFCKSVIPEPVPEPIKL